MFLNALAVFFVFAWLAGAIGCVAAEKRDPLNTYNVSPFVSWGGVVGALWLVFG